MGTRLGIEEQVVVGIDFGGHIEDRSILDLQDLVVELIAIFDVVENIPQAEEAGRDHVGEDYDADSESILAICTG